MFAGVLGLRRGEHCADWAYMAFSEVVAASVGSVVSEKVIAAIKKAIRIVFVLWFILVIFVSPFVYEENETLLWLLFVMRTPSTHLKTKYNAELPADYGQLSP